MYQNHTIAVIIPAYQEELLIERTISSVPAFVDRVFVIDDGSTDRTAEVAGLCADRDSRCRLIVHPRNRGAGAAVSTGYKAALEENIDIAAVMDGDGQMEPSALPSLLDPIVKHHADYTKGNRLLSPEYRRGMSSWRFAGNSILTVLTKFSSGYWNLMDPQNGYTAISRKALKRINLDTIYPRYGYLNDILVRLNVYSFRVMNVEIPAKYGSEKSKIKYGTYIRKLSWLLVRDFFYRLRLKYVVLSFHPLVFFYLFGMILTVCGIVAGIYTLFFKFVLDGTLFIRAVLSILIFALGIQFLSFALLFDIQENRELSLLDQEE